MAHYKESLLWHDRITIFCRVFRSTLVFIKIAPKKLHNILHGTIISILDIIRTSVFYLKTRFDTGFRLLFQVEPTQMGPKERVSLCLLTVRAMT
jgi:hypothetical protein